MKGGGKAKLSATVDGFKSWREIFEKGRHCWIVEWCVFLFFFQREAWRRRELAGKKAVRSGKN